MNIRKVTILGFNGSLSIYGICGTEEFIEIITLIYIYACMYVRRMSPALRQAVFCVVKACLL